MITENQIDELARQFQIDRYSILREYLQLLFLKCFYEQKESKGVYFKGGTAIHFLYRSFRFSEDLDFTSLLPIKGIQKLLQETIRLLGLEAAGIEGVNRGVKDHSLTEIIRYHYASKHPLTIRLEFSLREKPLTHKVSPIETIFPIAVYPLVVHLDAEELLAEKIRAIITRHKGRDLFDLWFLLSKEVKINEEYVKNKMKWYKMGYQKQDLLKAIEKYKAGSLENDLRMFLPKNYRPFIGELKDKTLYNLKKTEMDSAVKREKDRGSTLIH